MSGQSSEADRVKVLLEREIRECSVGGCSFAERPGMPDESSVATIFCVLSERLIEPGKRTGECLKAERKYKVVLERQEAVEVLQECVEQEKEDTEKEAASTPRQGLYVEVWRCDECGEPCKVEIVTTDNKLPEFLKGRERFVKRSCFCEETTPFWKRGPNKPYKKEVD